MSTSVDNMILQWKSYLTSISSNLMELTDQTEYQLIKAKAGDRANGYVGLTMERAAKCVERVAELWQHFALLSEVVEKAVALNNRQGLLYDPEDDVRELFEKTPVVIDKQHVDIKKRDLLGNETNEEKAVPRELLKHMQESFEELRRDITEISMAEETLQSRLNNIKKDIERLKAVVKHLAIDNVPPFDFQGITGIERDPLKGQVELDKLVYSLEKYRASIKKVEEEYKEVLSKLQRTRDILNELRDVSKKSWIVIERSREFLGTSDFRNVIGENIIESLEEWQQVLESKLSGGNLKAVGIGVLKLEKECMQKLETERANYNFNSKAYNEWMDLKGQFNALVAKAEVFKARGLLMDGSVENIIIGTREAFDIKPVNIEHCREMVKKLGLSL